jgi:putative DNA primase/helicase
MEEEEIRAALEVMNRRRCDPPLEADEVQNIAASVSRYEPADNGAALRVNGRRVTGEGEPSFNLTDMGNAERLIARHGEDLRYCYPWAKWLIWDGRRWVRDDSGKLHNLAKETVRSIYQEAASAADEEARKALAKHATRSEAEVRVRAMIELAKSEVAILPDKLDAVPDLLNCENGTIDLRTGELQEHRRENLITKIAPVQYQPGAEASAWESFLERVLPSKELRGFVQRAAGYSATGDTSEQCMFINHGAGANGKSTFQEAVSAALGDYAMRAPTEMLLARRAGGVPNDVARLKGARFVSASETEEGRRLAESLIKDLTGQDTITARFMRAEFFDFRPTHKLWLSTNHKPEIRGTDTAIWRRIRLVPWSVTIPPAEQDKRLPVTLRRELPGVLAWIVRGCLEWRRGGLRAPDEVRRATVAYRAEMDVLAAFVSECCEEGVNFWDYSKELYETYKRWCEDNGERTENKRRFGERLRERGFERDRGGARGAHIWRGVRLKEPE